MLKKMIKKFFLSLILSVLGLATWIVIGALDEQAKVAGGSWFEMTLGLFAIWIIAAIITEFIFGNSALHVFADMIAVIIAITIVLTVGKFGITFVSVPEAVRSMKWPFIVTPILNIFFAFGSEGVSALISKIGKK